MTFMKGESGNTKGRPPGIANQKKLRDAIAKDLPDIIAKTVELAKDGDTAAIKLLIDRVLPPLKSVDRPVAIPIGDTLADSGRGVLQAVGDGRITPDEAVRLMQGIGALARVIEVDELERRIEALEHEHTQEPCRAIGAARR